MGDKLTTGLDRNFRKLWAALSISTFGSEITLLALPLFATISLQADAFQMGVLASAGQLPYLLCSLIAGGVVDRVRRRVLLVICDLVSAAALLTIPIVHILGGASFIQLCAVSFVVGTAAVFAEVAHYSYVPTLVGRHQLTEANSRLQISYSVAESAGPGVGGLLVQVLTAPFAILINAGTFLVSGLTLRSIRDEEQVPMRSEQGASIPATLLQGMRPLLGHRLLRPIILTGICVAFFEGAFVALYVVFATRELDLSPAVIGLIFVIGGIGSLPGAVLAKRAGDRFGVGPAIVVGLFGSALSLCVLPLAQGHGWWVVLALGIAKAVGALSFTIANIHQWTLRQALTADSMAGRVTAAQRFLVYGSGSLGALGGGALGGIIGLRGALAVFAVGAILAPIFTLLSPVRKLRNQPEDNSDELIISDR